MAVMKELKDVFDITAYINLYPEVSYLTGIYSQQHNTNQRILLIVTLVSGKRETRSYPRAIMELHIGRILDYPNETVDHIDNDPLNNKIENLQIISLANNAKKAHADGIAYKPPKGVRVSDHDTNGSANSMSKISEEQVLKYRRQYTSGRSKKAIIDECGLTRKSVENFLFGRTYKLVPEQCEPRPYERST